MNFRCVALLCAGLFLWAASLSAQDMGSIDFIHKVAEKQKTTFSDAVNFYILTLDKQPASFEANLSLLNKEGITTGYDLSGDTTLRRGVLARMVARHLKLSDSAWYNIFGSERYAFRACVAAGIMPANGSEWDKVSGEELIEIMRRVADLTGGEA